MNDLQKIEDQIAGLERGVCEVYREGWSEDGVDVILDDRAPTPAEICEALSSIEGSLRGRAWSPSYQAWASELIARADREIRRLCEAHGLLYGRPHASTL